MAMPLTTCWVNWAASIPTPLSLLTSPRTSPESRNPRSTRPRPPWRIPPRRIASSAYQAPSREAFTARREPPNALIGVRTADARKTSRMGGLLGRPGFHSARLLEELVPAALRARLEVRPAAVAGPGDPP